MSLSRTVKSNRNASKADVIIYPVIFIFPHEPTSVKKKTKKKKKTMKGNKFVMKNFLTHLSFEIDRKL